MYGNSCQVTNPVVADGVTEPLSPDALDLDQRHLRHVRHLGARIEVTDHARPCIPVIERDVGMDLAADDAPLERSHLERPLEGLVLLFGRKAEAGEGVDVRALQRADPADDRGGLDALFLDHVLEALEEEIIAFEDRQDDPRRALRHEVVHRRPPTERWASTLHVGATLVKARALSLRHHQAWRGAARAAGNAGLRVPPQ